MGGWTLGDQGSLTCDFPGPATKICQALSGTTTSTVTLAPLSCDLGYTQAEQATRYSWRVNICGANGQDGTAIAAYKNNFSNQTACSDVTTGDPFTLRPCIETSPSNWGGAKTTNVNPPNQNIYFKCTKQNIKDSVTKNLSSCLNPYKACLGFAVEEVISKDTTVCKQRTGITQAARVQYNAVGTTAPHSVDNAYSFIKCITRSGFYTNTAIKDPCCKTALEHYANVSPCGMVTFL